MFGIFSSDVKALPNLKWVDQRLDELYRVLPYVSIENIYKIANLGIVLGWGSCGREVRSGVALDEFRYETVDLEYYYREVLGDPYIITQDKINQVVSHCGEHATYEMARWIVRATIIHNVVKNASKIRLSFKGKCNLDDIVASLIGFSKTNFCAETNKLIAYTKPILK